MRCCEACRVSKDLNEFNLSSKEGHQRWCKECMAKHAKTRRERGRTFISEAKDVPCMDCHKRYPYYVMDLDHRPGETKLFSIGENAIRPLEILAIEIAKCDVVCANCHRRRTHSER